MNNFAKYLFFLSITACFTIFQCRAKLSSNILPEDIKVLEAVKYKFKTGVQEFYRLASVFNEVQSLVDANILAEPIKIFNQLNVLTKIKPTWEEYGNVLEKIKKKFKKLKNDASSIPIIIKIKPKYMDILISTSKRYQEVRILARQMRQNLAQVAMIVGNQPFRKCNAEVAKLVALIDRKPTVEDFSQLIAKLRTSGQRKKKSTSNRVED